jgi:hypothetical protein
METVKLEIPRAEARHLYREYKKHRHYSEPMDDEIRRAYQLLAQGRLIIKALESVRAAGVDAKGFPKLALCRADAERCRWSPNWGGNAGTMTTDRGQWVRNSRAADQTFTFREWPAIPRNTNAAVAIVPIVPIHLRPKRALANYHVLWEAVWEPAPPVDPYLLRRIGKSDMWLVLAMWNLTEVERAAMASRIASA